MEILPQLKRRWNMERPCNSDFLRFQDSFHLIRGGDSTGELRLPNSAYPSPTLQNTVPAWQIAQVCETRCESLWPPPIRPTCERSLVGLFHWLTVIPLPFSGVQRQTRSN